MFVLPLRLPRLTRRVAARGWAVYAAFYLLTLAGGPVLDASIERASGPGAPHIETERPACPVHDHQECQLCRTLRTLPLGPAAVFTAPLSDTIVSSPQPVRDAPAARPLDPSQSPRAPPLS